MRGWQPIKTAPKTDNTSLIYFPKDDEVGWDGVEPTHWVPLPEPPGVVMETLHPEPDENTDG